MTGEAVVTEMRPAHRFDADRLEAWLIGRLPDFEPPLRVRQFEGGQSNPTFLLEAGDRRWVLRKKPTGVLLPSAHQVGREYTIIKALDGSGVPVPTARLHCEDPEVIGTEFFIMDCVEGRVFGDPLLPDLTPAERRALYEDQMKVLARLHAVDYAAVGLGDGFGRPGNYYERQISRWTRSYIAAQTEDIPEMTRLMEWLPANIPADDQVTIVHGDSSLRNCMTHPTEPRIAAVLDWELSTIGHPYADVAFATLFQMGDTSQDDIVALGIPSQQEMFDLYFAASGRPPPADWTFYLAFILFRIAAINQGVYKRGLDGNAASDTYMLAVPGIKRSSAYACRLIAERGL